MIDWLLWIHKALIGFIRDWGRMKDSLRWRRMQHAERPTISNSVSRETERHRSRGG